MNYWIVFIVIAATDAYDPALLIANEDGVFYMNMKTEGSKVVIPFSLGTNGMDYHFVRKDIYVILKHSNQYQYRVIRIQDSDTYHKKLNKQLILPTWCARVKACATFNHLSQFSTPTEIIMPDHCNSAANLLVDWKHDNIYWTCDPGNKAPFVATIHLAHISGTDHKPILEFTNQTWIVSLAIDPYVGKLFFLYADLLRSANLDGKKVSTIYQFSKDDINKPLFIRVDLHRNKIYVFGNMYNDDDVVISSMNYDGSDFKMYYTCKDYGRKLGAEIVNSKVFWIVNTTVGNNESCTATDNSTDVQLGYFNVLKNMLTWKIYHPDAQNPVLDCASHICLPECQPESWHFDQCSYPSGLTLSTDNSSSSETSETVEPELYNNSIGLPTDQPVNNVDSSNDETKNAEAIVTSYKNFVWLTIAVGTICSSVLITTAAIYWRQKRRKFKPELAE